MKKLLFIMIIVFSVLSAAQAGFSESYELPEGILKVDEDESFIYCHDELNMLYIYDKELNPIIQGEYNYSTNKFKDGVLLVSKTFSDENGSYVLYGFIDIYGNIAVDAAYSFLSEPVSGKIVGILNGKTYLINTRGEMINCFGGVYGYFGDFVNGHAVVRDEPLAGKCYLGKNEFSALNLPEGAPVSVTNPSAAQPYLEENADLCQGGYYIIDESGNVLIDDLSVDIDVINVRHGSGAPGDPPSYKVDVVMHIPEFNEFGIMIVRRGNAYDILNSDGALYTGFNILNYKIVNYKILATLINPDSFGSTFYCFNMAGELMYSNNFEYVYNTGEIRLANNKDETAYLIKSGGKFGVISESGYFYYPPEYDIIIPSDIDYNYLFVLKDGKYGVLTMYGELIEPKFDELYLSESYESYLTYSKGFILKAREGNIFYAVNLDNLYQVCVECDDLNILPKSDYVAVKKDGKYGLMNYNNEVVVSFEYDEIKQNVYKYGNNALLKSNNKERAVNLETGYITDEYDCIELFDYNVKYVEDTNKDKNHFMCAAYTNNKIRIIDLKTQKQSEYYDYDYTYHFQIHSRKLGENSYDNVFIVAKDGKSGVIDKDFNIIIPILYDRVYYENLLPMNYILVMNNNKYGAFDALNGNVLLPVEYDKIIYTDIDSSILEISKDGKTEQVDILKLRDGANFSKSRSG